MFIKGIFSFNIKNIIGIYSVAMRAFFGYKKQIIILTILGFLSGLFEAIGINALIPLFSFFSDQKSREATDFITIFIKNTLEFFHIPFTLLIILVLICTMFIFKATIVFYFDLLRVKIRTEYEAETMSSLYKNTLSADWPYLSKQKLGHLETIIMTNVRQSGGFLENIARTIGLVSSFIMYFLVALNISKTITVITIVLGAVIFFVFKPILYKVRKLSEKTEDLNKEVSHHVNQSIGGIKSIKAFGNEGEFIKKSNLYFDMLRSLQIKTFAIQNASLSVIQPIGVIFISLVVAFAYFQTSYNLGVLAAIVYLIQKMFGYVQSLQSFAQQISGSIPYIESVLLYQDKAHIFIEQKVSTGHIPFSFSKEISFNNVSFAYDDKSDAISDISFKLEKGSTLGIIGKSGAGKTTIFDLLLRLLNPTSGEIKADNINIQNINISDWRSHIAYVPQDIFLLNDTIYNNIVFYDQNINKQDVERAVKIAHLDELIKELPEGYNTMIGERGVRLSGGQKQRIAIARAFSRKPDIFILDEATSALDIESEVFIQQAIKDLKGKVTVIIIAHRLSTIAQSDKLIVLEKGLIVEEGSPLKMLKDKETYYSRMYSIRD